MHTDDGIHFVCDCGATLTKRSTSYNSDLLCRRYYRCRKCNERYTVWSDIHGNIVKIKNTSVIGANGKKNGYKRETICYKCDNAYGNGCSWFRSYTPVPGWEAIKQKYYENDISYTVIKCPEFRPDRKRKKHEQVDIP